MVAVDDATLQQGAWFERNRRIPAWARGIGSMPWPRAAYGQVAEKLLQAGAAAVAINVLFEGPSASGPADDAAMETLLARHRGRIALAAEMLEGSDAQAAGSLTLVRPELYLQALGGPGVLGLTNILPRLPGRPSLHPEAYGGALLPAQGMEAYPSLSSTLLRIGGRRSRQDDVRAALNFYGPEGTFRRLSAWEVLDPDRWSGHPQRSALKEALVVVGPVLAQGDDGYPTPFGPLPGLEMLATATANSLDGSGLRPWPQAAWHRALLAALPVLLVVLAALRWRGLAIRLGLVGGLLALVIGAAGVGLWRAHRWLPLLSPASGLAVLALVYGGDAYLREERERRRLRGTFERYVAPGVVAAILADPDAAQGVLRGRLLEVTVLMADLKGFTQLTRRRSREGHTELHVRQLNAYLAAMVEVIGDHGGTVDKFIGDAVMAVFGSPVSRGVAQEAEAALRCGLAMRRALADLNRQWQAEGLEPLDNGVGLASGEAMVGQIGSPRRMEFTVIGDIVNLAARLEALTRRVDEPLLLDGRTAELVAGAVDLSVRPLGPQEVKGMGMVEVFAPAGDVQKR
jgi:adenylate cyclase